MWELVAPFAAELPEQESNGQLPVLIFGLLGTVVVVLGTVLVALINSRANRTTASPPAPAPLPNSRDGERIAVLEHRAEDSDDRDEMQDRHLENNDHRLDDHAARLGRIEARLDLGGSE